MEFYYGKFQKYVDIIHYHNYARNKLIAVVKQNETVLNCS